MPQKCQIMLDIFTIIIIPKMSIFIILIDQTSYIQIQTNQSHIFPVCLMTETWCIENKKGGENIEGTFITVHTLKQWAYNFSSAV